MESVCAFLFDFKVWAKSIPELDLQLDILEDTLDKPPEDGEEDADRKWKSAPFIFENSSPSSNNGSLVNK